MKDEQDEVVKEEAFEAPKFTMKILEDGSDSNLPNDIVDLTKTEPIVEDPKPADVVIEAPIVENTKEEVVVVEQPIIDSEIVKNYLKENHGIEVKDFEDLKPKELKKYSDAVEKFQKFVDETGNDNFEAFASLQKDWTKEPKENVLRAIMKAEKPYLEDEDIDLLLQDKYGIEELDEFASESEKRANRLKEISFKDDYQKGLEFLESQKEKYKVVKGFDDIIPDEYKSAKQLVDNWQQQKEESDIVNAKLREEFVLKTDSVFNKDFEGFKINVDGQELKVKPEDVQQEKTILSDLSNFDKKFFDEKGSLKDPEGYYKALYFGMNPEKVAKHFIEIGKAMQLEQEEKESKNIRVEGNKLPSGGGMNPKVTMKILNP